MADLNIRTTSILAVALLVPVAAGVWLVLNPELASASTYAIFAALIIGVAGVTIHTWKSAQATVSTSQLIHETEVAVASRTQAPKR